MRNKFKTTTIAAAAIVSLLLFVYLYAFFTRPSSMLAYLPEIPERRQYVLVETRAKTFPSRLAAFLTEGPFALLHRGTAANALLSLAKTASDTAVLVTNDAVQYGIETVAISAAYKLPSRMSSNLGKGKLPTEWREIIPDARIEKGEAAGSWEIWSTAVDAPVYYYTDKDYVIMAADSSTFANILAVRHSKKGTKHTWQSEKRWPAHIEFGDGGNLLNVKTPLKIQIAWRPLDNKGKKTPTGEAKWTVSGLRTDHRMFLSLMAAKPTEWDTSQYTIPEEPILVSALNLPKLKGSPEKWPAPLSSAAKMGKTLGLSQESISKILSGKTVFSLGGKNKLLWLTLPGVLAQFSGNEESMQELVNAFWGQLFSDTEPKKLSGWTYGGVVNSPFSVVSAGRNDSALVGMISSDSLQSGEGLSRYISKREKAIGWIAVDLPKLGESLENMAKVMSLLAFEDGGDNNSDMGLGGFSPYHPSEMDQGVTNALRKILTKFGSVVVVWERPTSGRINWYYPSDL